MTDKAYIVEGRQFRTESDYKRACKDKETIVKLRDRLQGENLEQLKQLKTELNSGKYHFYTLLEQDFKDEIEERIKKAQESPRDGAKRKSKMQGKAKEAKTPEGKKTQPAIEVDDAYVQKMLKQRERNRRLLILACSLFAVCSLGYFGFYSYHMYRTNATYDRWSELKERDAKAETPGPAQDDSPVVIHYDDQTGEAPEVLEKYKNLLNKNKKLIGWLQIDDTKINYPVMQTTDNEYYLTHNINQEYDKNGTIFMDKDCDVLKPSTNFILYGHNMVSGQMFAKLEDYEKKEFCEKHPYINFDTIYETGIYQVMYVFRSKVYSEGEITFKYYQFIDAFSEQEFDSNMQEMAEMSLYDTGVTAEYGDQLLTLSTCDYQEKNGRFVVVAKKVQAKEQ
ncbi:MAG: class B sortase [Bacteroidales bacterium]|nr:class B sortase [Lachnoclostridium sp.]MCM1383010.1 class B sortase [Lachnoclostridium sp.]MCM1463935.1 class B sortase [Bacteroidales bacterium]